ncbi:MAG: hypothetical protein WC127_04560 [Acidaminococcaceae bacterium]|nr:hypothetical protein [Acidaminococcaceae bacterium]
MFFLKNGLKILGMLWIAIFLAGCDYNDKQANVEARELITQQADVKIQTTTWLTYWDLQDGAVDLKKISPRLEALAFFGAYFDKDQNVFIPKELQLKHSGLKKSGNYTEYLTVVNDRLNADGSTSMKNIEMLKTVLGTEKDREHHIAAIMALAKNGNYGGIEIDYERVWKDAKTKELFLKFIDRLYCESREQNLKLRIILEPSTPFSTTNFVVGPEYVVMLYNLYGTHTILPGPKADTKFIKKTLAKMNTLPEPKAVAYSNGGCSWNTKGQRKFITEKEALEIIKKYKRVPVRDGDSQCLVLKYRKGITFYSVWYADATTMNYWISLAKEAGIQRVSLWRLGGNTSIEKVKL